MVYFGSYNRNVDKGTTGLAASFGCSLAFHALISSEAISTLRASRIPVRFLTTVSAGVTAVVGLGKASEVEGVVTGSEDVAGAVEGSTCVLRWIDAFRRVTEEGVTNSW